MCSWGLKGFLSFSSHFFHRCTQIHKHTCWKLWTNHLFLSWKKRRRFWADFWIYHDFIFSIFNPEQNWITLPPNIKLFVYVWLGSRKTGICYRGNIFLEHAGKWLCGVKLLSNSIYPCMRYESKFKMTDWEFKAKQFNGKQFGTDISGIVFVRVEVVYTVCCSGLRLHSSLLLLPPPRCTHPICKD